MKKIVLFLLMSIICLDVWSQSKSKTHIKFGFKLGMGMHTITGCPLKTKPAPDFLIGLWFQIKISKNWTMQSELGRIDKGTETDNQNPPTYGDYRLELSYFEVPILFQYNKKQTYLEFGPGFASLINVGEYSSSGTIPYPVDLYLFSNKDITFNLGAGIVLNEKWRIGLRLIHSLLPVRKQLPEISQQVYNRSIVLIVSRQIRFKSSKTKQSQDIE